MKLLILVLSLAFAATEDHAKAESFQDGKAAVEITEEGSTAKEANDSRMQRTAANKAYPTRVGRQAAAKYMSPQKPTDSTGSDRGPASDTPRDHYLAVHLGWFVNDNAYKWGAPDSQTNVGRWNTGITYRMGEWINSMDLLFRFDVARYALAEGGVTKFTMIPLIVFPDASSRFPLYFGGGLGLGVFGNQIAGESSLSLDYQLVAGARFFNIWGQMGLIVEAGIKNHLFLLSDGQFNGTFISTGLVFTF